MAWYPRPFTKGHLYRVKRDISFLNHVFVCGEKVQFEGDAYDAKGGVIRFWFKNLANGETNAWHVWEDQLTLLGEWQTFFEPLHESGGD